MIYFMQPVGGGPVKIGFSDDVDKRREQLERHYGRPLALLATMPGDMGIEYEIHRRFSHLRFGRTEQFRPASDLMAFIGRPLLVDPNPETVESMVPAGPPSERNDSTVRMSRELVSRVKAVAEYRGVPVGQVMDEVARAGIDKAYAAMLRELEGSK